MATVKQFENQRALEKQESSNSASRLGQREESALFNRQQKDRDRTAETIRHKDDWRKR